MLVISPSPLSPPARGGERRYKRLGSYLSYAIVGSSLKLNQMLNLAIWPNHWSLLFALHNGKTSATMSHLQN